MEVLEAIKTRRSIRGYKKDPVPEEVLEQILEVGRWAPSASNMQPWEFITFTDPEVKRQVTRCFLYGWFMEEAPLGILVVVDPRVGQCPVEDGTLATYAIMLAAHGLGLGTCWIHPGTSDEKAKEILGIPREKRIICALSVGYPNEAPSKERRKLRDIVHAERYGNR